MTHAKLIEIESRIVKRSEKTRQDYLDHINQQAQSLPTRTVLGCTNLAHGYASAAPDEKVFLRKTTSVPNIGIVTAYNDMLSAHQPYHYFPELIKKAALSVGCTAQVAGGVPAMCDGVTQGQPGMELSLFSRDIIAQATSIALSHQMFDGVLCLGICDKIVPGLLMGALEFGHLPTLFVPSGPMPSGITNDQKADVRQRYAEGKLSDEDLLLSEEAAYHSPGTCTFYGTANSNQMLMEIMGLHVPGAAFVPPYSKLRDQLTIYAVNVLNKRMTEKKLEDGLGHLLNAKALINGMIGLLATGGSTNHTLHLIAIARAAGHQINWSDFHELSQIIPLIARVYPNGKADINQFQHAGGTAYVIGQLLQAGLLFGEAKTILGTTLEKATPSYSDLPQLIAENLCWMPPAESTRDLSILRPVDSPFQAHGGLQCISGDLGRAIIKTSAIPDDVNKIIQAPCRVFKTQQALVDAFQNNELEQDLIAVLPGQGPAANGMPELHQLTPVLSSLQSRGFNVALVTDGRMSGASGKIPAVIHVTPEAAREGLIGKLQTGDLLELNMYTSQLSYLGEDDLKARPEFVLPGFRQTVGRRIFEKNRANVSNAESGASFIV